MMTQKVVNCIFKSPLFWVVSILEEFSKFNVVYVPEILGHVL